MTVLEDTLKKTYDWASDRIWYLNLMNLNQDSEAIQQEFAEWFDETIDEHNIISLEFFGDV